MSRLCVLCVSLAFLVAAPLLRADDPVQFRRGDANGDGSTNLSDSVYTLLYLFEGSTASCEKALDANDDGRVDIGDASHGLFHLFSGGPRPPAPSLDCGTDPTPDALGCAEFPVCPTGGSSEPAPSSRVDDEGSDGGTAEREGLRRWSYAYGEGRTSLVEDATRCAAMIDPDLEKGYTMLQSALEKVGGFARLRPGDQQEYPGLWYPRFLKGTPEEGHVALIEKLHAMPGIRFAAPVLIYGRAIAIPRPEIIVTVDADAQQEDLVDLLAQPDLRLIREFPSIDTTFHFAFDGSPVECFARCDALNDLEVVFVAEPNMIWDLPKLAAPNDPLYSQQWDLNNTGQTGGTAGADMRAETAWDTTTGSSTIVIAICDEGVDVDHPDLAANMVAGHDSVTADSNPPSVPGDAGGNDAHGTCCAGIAAAVGNNGIGVAGISWNAKIMPVRLGFGNYWTATSWIIDAITWAADNGADVQSHSWGGGGASTSIENAFIYATTDARGGLGSACFCATGNDNSSVSYPARYPSTVGVGATSPCDERKSPSSCDGENWWGSNYGPEVDVCAPGPLVTTTDIAGSAGYSSTDYVNNFNGTSSATPHAAGAAALLLSFQPSLTAAQVQQYMEESADDEVGTSSEDTPGHDNYMGWGRLNLANMVALVGGGVTPPSSLTCVENGGSVDLSWTNGETYSTVVVARGGTAIATLAGSATSYTDTSPGVGNVSYTVTGTVDGSSSPTASCGVFLTGGATDLVFAPPAAAGAVNGGQGIVAALTANGRSPLLVSSLDAVASLDAFGAVWVNLGMYPDNHVLTAAEGSTLDTYLTNGSGGSFLYLEGGDTWAYDTATAVHARFGISGVSDGGSDLSTITGAAGTGCDLAGSSWSYTGENSWVDHLVASGTGVVTLSNTAQGYDIGLFNDGGSYLTFGTSFEIGGTADGAGLVGAILGCFDGGEPPPPPSPPTASFTTSAPTGFIPLTVTFTDTSSGVVDSWLWDFGDGVTATSQNPTHVYATAGTYTVSLTVTNSGGSDTETCGNCIEASTPPAPVAGFTSAPTSGDYPLTVSFTDTTSGVVDSRSWSFGDGGTSTSQNPTHVYTAAGSYTVTLTATNVGGSDTATCTDCITVTTPPPPPVILACNNREAVAGASISPTVIETRVISGSVAGTTAVSHAFEVCEAGNNFLFSFCDPASTVDYDPWICVLDDTGAVLGSNDDTCGLSSEVSVSLSPGNYHVVVSGYSNSAGSYTLAYSADVNNCDTPPPATPTADFTATPTSGETPLAVSFTDASTGDITSYSWDFGDGGSSTLQDPSHTYTTAGNYTVSLTVTGPGGSDTATCSGCITVTDPVPAPTASFTLSPAGGEAPALVSFTDTSTGNITDWAWDFGDGGTSTLQDPSHTYSTAGTYTVTLTVTGAGGSDMATCSSCVEVTDPVPAPTAGFTLSPAAGEAPVLVSFTDTSTGNISGWSWDFGDGGTSTLQDPSHTYTTAGTYTVMLTVTGPGGSDVATCFSCVDVTAPVAAPVADFMVSPLGGETPLLVSFFDMSTGTITGRTWDFGDGGASTLQDPSHTYTTAGTYTVTLTVTGPGGSDVATCPSCVEVTDPVPAPTAGFTLSPSGGEAPVLVSFTDTSTGDITDWMWDFGDGFTDSLPNPTHTYEMGGTYSVTLMVSGPGGTDMATCSNCVTVTDPVPAPIAGFSPSSSGGEAPVTVSFLDMSMGDITARSWAFGDGATSTSQNPSHTYTTAGTYTVTLTVTGPGGSDMATCGACITVTDPPPPPPPSGNPKIYISFKGTANVPGVGTVRDEDIVAYDPDAGTWAMYFDGSDVGLGGTDIDAFSVRADGSIVLSFNSGSFSVPGLVGGPAGTSVDDSDLIEFTPVSTGDTTEGSLTFLFDGSDVGLTTNGEDIDGVCWLEDGTFLFSTQGTARGNGPTARDEDILTFVPTALGSTTAGTWETFFDGSDVGYSNSSQEDVDGFGLTPDQSLLLSTVGLASAGGASGDDEDLFLFSGTFGSTTSGSSTIAVFLSSLGIDPSEDVDGISNR